MTLVRTERDYRLMLRELRVVSDDRADLAIDTETTGLRLYQDDYPTGISCAYWWPDDGPDAIHSWYLSIAHPDSKNFSSKRLVRAVNRHKGVQVYHHSEYDWRSLTLAYSVFKVPDSEHLYDTQTVEWLLDENADHRLKQMSAIYFGEDAKAEQNHIKELKRGRKASDIYKELRALPEWQKPRPAVEAREESKRLAALTKKSWDTFTVSDLSAYGARDAELTLMCKREQELLLPGRPTLAAELPDAALREYELLHVMYRMMGTGVRVDAEACIAQAKVAQKRLDELAANFVGINLNSVPQLIELVYGEWGIKVKHRTKTGAPSTAREALEEHDNDPRIMDLLEYRHLNKAMVGYYRPLYETIAEDGRIHPSFSSSRTVTGRLSCSDPNLMTIPRADTLEGVRDLFVPEPGYELWEYDLAQAELRIMASFCEDETLMAALERGDDLHSLTASRVFGPNFTPLQRRLGKNLNYGFPYGIGPRKFAKYRVAGTSNPVTECGYWKWSKFDDVKRPRRCGKCHVCMSADDLEGYRRAYPKLVQLIAGLERVARKDGVLPMIVEGRYRHFRSPGRLIHYYTALNAVVQGGVAECMKSYMIAAEPRLIAMGARLCLQVHDSFVIEVLPGTGLQVGELLQCVADEHDYFLMRMIFESNNWSDHD
jgi:DNA polymerase I-like protein with 3'-5' exonuclease and polymerase domains